MMQVKKTLTENNVLKIETEIKLSGSLMEMEEAIQTACNNVGQVATEEALHCFDTNGNPIVINGKKLTSKGKLEKCYQCQYGEIAVYRHVYQASDGGKQYCPLEEGAHIINCTTPKFAKTVSSKYAI